MHARAIDFADHYELGDKDPDFLERLYTVPLQAFIPRFLWSGKPLENIGWMVYSAGLGLSN